MAELWAVSASAIGTVMCVSLGGVALAKMVGYNLEIDQFMQKAHAKVCSLSSLSPHSLSHMHSFYFTFNATPHIYHQVI
jgi:adenine/guanine phosphoribosyltransferase-like PRPP-binding protein